MQQETLSWMQGLRERYHSWMNDDQFECWIMFCDLLMGANHQFGKVRDAGQNGIEITEFSAGGWSTFDLDRLTRAVVMAHDRCIRFSISPCNFQYLRFHLHKRDRNEKSISLRHPTMEEAVSIIRKSCQD